MEHTRVAIIGAGFSGIGMAARLLKDGIDDFVVIERADEVGGTWRDNTYPGCQCDIPSVLYSYSFMPNPDWTRAYPLQAEIREYLKRCAQRTRRHAAHRVRRGGPRRAVGRRGPALAATDVSGRADRERPHRRHGRADRAAVPRDRRDSTPSRGRCFTPRAGITTTTSTGERVAVIGTGASSIQFVPEIQPSVGKLTLFQRTPAWVLPDPDRRLGDRERNLYRNFPAAQRAMRALTYLSLEATVLGTIVDRRLISWGEAIGRRHIATQVQRPRAAREADAHRTRSAASGSRCRTSTTAPSPSRTRRSSPTRSPRSGRTRSSPPTAPSTRSTRSSSARASRSSTTPAWR